jgi:peptide/nickel transport system substrate-binding protein
MLILSEGFDRNMQLLIQPYHYIPYWRYLTWATQYGLWYESNGRSGWKPPESIARIQEIYDKIKLSADVQERHELMGQILDIHAENLWIIGGLSELPEPVIVSPRAGNIPKEVVTDWLFMSPGNAHPEQFYVKW